MNRIVMLTIVCLNLVFILISLAACGPGDIYNIHIRSIRTDNPSEHRFEVLNNTNRNISLASAPRIEQQLDGEWHTVKEISHFPFYIDAGEWAYYSATWELPRGRYRLIMPFECRRNADLQVEAAGQFEIWEQIDLDITMQVLPDSISPWGAAFLVTNNSGYDLESFNGDFGIFTIETYQDGKWSACWAGSNNIPTINLPDGEQKVIAHTWARRAIGSLPTRIVKTFWYRGENYMVWDKVYAAFASQPREIEDIGITLEVTDITWDRLSLLTTNHTSYYAVFNNTYMDNYSPFTIEQNVDGRWVTFRSYGHHVANGFVLPPGGYREWGLRIADMDPGQFRLEKSFAIGLESPDTTRTMGVQAEFAIDDFRIDDDLHGIYMTEYIRFRSNVMMLRLTNAFQEGAIYFDRDYDLQKYVDGVWVDMPKLASESTLGGEQFLGARQQRFIVKYWGWLYGELDPGRYRIVKTFWHHAPDGVSSQHELYAAFDGWNSSRHLSINGGIIYRAEVLREAHRPRPLDSKRLLLYGLSPGESDDTSRHSNRYSGREFDMFENAHVVVFDVCGQQILFSDIPQGAVVEIISMQAFPYGAVLIQVVA
ncbi:MAG: hypothetical protein FWD03_00680 [Defluviitaleaceae bacterium]|nr:hypothetical protein [Defluviitaleaceae bacterium]